MNTCAWCSESAVADVEIGRRGKVPLTAPACAVHRDHFAEQRGQRERATSLRRSAAQDARHGRDDVAARKRDEAAELDREVRLG